MSSQSFAARPSVLYRLALMAVTLAMAILPCLYLALIALVVYGVYLFVTQYFVPIWLWPEDHNRPPVFMQVALSCGPVVMGFAVVALMLKPLFSRRAKGFSPLALGPEANEHVYTLVREVSRRVGAPVPLRIELSCDLNAAAGFENGLKGFFGGRLVLTLGLPLVAGLTQRELAAILAHELGHFRQRTGMRMSQLIRMVNGWFARVVYEREGWAASLGDLAARPGGQHVLVVILVFCTHFGVMATRGVLWLLMMAGHAVSAAFMREMEHDADRSESRVAGSAAFESTMAKLPALETVYGQVLETAAQVWHRQGRLPDNLPALVAHVWAGVPPGDQAAWWDQASRRKTAWLDTHPSLAERVRRARQRADAGHEISDAPAHELFGDFDGLCRQLTRSFYSDNLKLRLRRDTLLPLDRFQPVATALPPPPPLPSIPPRPRLAGKAAGAKADTGGYDPRRYLGPAPRIR